MEQLQEARHNVLSPLRRSNVFVFSTSTLESALISRNSIDIIVWYLPRVYGTAFSSRHICILFFFVFVFFATAVFETRHQRTDSLGVNPVEDLMCSHAGFFRLSLSFYNGEKSPQSPGSLTRPLAFTYSPSREATLLPDQSNNFSQKHFYHS